MTRRAVGRWVLALILPTALWAGPLQEAGGDAPSLAGRAATGAWTDFNADGFADQAIGVPFEDVDAVADAGAVHVMYGSAAGLQATAPEDQVWTQDSPDVEGVAEVGDAFGQSLVTGDFNADGFTDLAVAAPFDDVDTVADAGGVNVLYGSVGGLQATSPVNQLLTRASLGGAEQAIATDRFGFALDAADFNGDGSADLAIGTPNADSGSFRDAGVVHVLHGSPTGLGTATFAGDIQAWTQDSLDVDDQAGSFDLFGWRLVGGDYNGDSFDDLAIGAPLDNPTGIVNAGVVNVLYGSAGGLQVASPEDQVWTQDSPDVEDQSELDDEYGAVLTMGDFNGDGFDDLAIGVTSEDLDLLGSAALVHVLYGSADGLRATAPDDQVWTQDSPDVEDEAEHQDRFGWWLAEGDFNADGFCDLAISARLEDVGDVVNAGAVHILYGSADGLQTASPEDQFWTQDSADVEDTVEEGDRFGRALGAEDFNGDGFADLAIGVPAEDFLVVRDVGAMSVLFGSPAGLQATSPEDQLWSQDSLDIEEIPEFSDQFAGALPGGA